MQLCVDNDGDYFALALYFLFQPTITTYCRLRAHYVWIARHQERHEGKNRSQMERNDNKKTKKKVHRDENIVENNSYVLHKNSSYRDFIMILAVK